MTFVAVLSALGGILGFLASLAYNFFYVQVAFTKEYLFINLIIGFIIFILTFFGAFVFFEMLPTGEECFSVDAIRGKVECP